MVLRRDLRYLTDFKAFIPNGSGGEHPFGGRSGIFDLREAHRIGEGKFPISKLEIKALE